ncbi:MAG: pantetheine-phosphate adenylyltransferase [Candidatus Micrarchaeia archaeon]
MNRKITKCVYAGSFDPPTNGHLWMIEKGSQLFDRLIVAIGINSEKSYTFSVEERIEMLKEITKDISNVEITHFEDKFLVKYAKEIGAEFILRGIRDTKDYEYEKSMRSINEDIDKDITTIFLMPPEKLSKVSSSLVKGLVGSKGWEKIVAKYVPNIVLSYLKNRHTIKKSGSPLDIDKNE